MCFTLFVTLSVRVLVGAPLRYCRVESGEEVPGEAMFFIYDFGGGVGDLLPFDYTQQYRRTDFSRITWAKYIVTVIFHHVWRGKTGGGELSAAKTSNSINMAGAAFEYIYFLLLFLCCCVCGFVCEGLSSSSFVAITIYQL